MFASAVIFGNAQQLDPGRVIVSDATVCPVRWMFSDVG